MKCDKCKQDFPRDEIKQSKDGAFSPLRYYCEDCYSKHRTTLKIFSICLGIFFALFFVIWITVLLVVI